MHNVHNHNIPHYSSVVFSAPTHSKSVFSVCLPLIHSHFLMRRLWVHLSRHWLSRPLLLVLPSSFLSVFLLGVASNSLLILSGSGKSANNLSQFKEESGTGMEQCRLLSFLSLLLSEVFFFSLLWLSCLSFLSSFSSFLPRRFSSSQLSSGS